MISSHCDPVKSIEDRRDTPFFPKLHSSEKMSHYLPLSSAASGTSMPSSHQRSFLRNTFVQKAVHVFKGGAETTSERRAMKVLGIVFFVFLVAWLPFSILNILSAACPSCGIQASLLNLTSWLGYISSNLNPVGAGRRASRDRSRFSASDNLHGIQRSLSSRVRLDLDVPHELLLSQAAEKEPVRLRRVGQSQARLARSRTVLLSDASIRLRTSRTIGGVLLFHRRSCVEEVPPPPHAHYHLLPSRKERPEATIVCICIAMTIEMLTLCHAVERERKQRHSFIHSSSVMSASSVRRKFSALFS